MLSFVDTVEQRQDLTERNEGYEYNTDFLQDKIQRG